MNTKVYEKTRYQNIYRHKKNKNYLIMISKPVKTSIASIDGSKIMRIEDAIRVRDNYKIKKQKESEIIHKDEFDNLFDKYIFNCEKVKKLAFNTMRRKKQIYNTYLKGKFKKVSKLTKNDISLFLTELHTTDKEKNEILRVIKAFFNWCVEEEHLIYSPAEKIKKYKTEKIEMKFWSSQEINHFLSALNYDIDNNINKEVAYRTKIFTLLGFMLGDRVGETRALTYDCIDENLGTIKIIHSINYNTKSDDFLSHTKNYQSQRVIDISEKLINEINNYRLFLSQHLNITINDNDLIFFNYSTKKPISDTMLRKSFHYYCDKSNVSKIRMYDLRHTYVAIMMEEGKELYHISNRIGHASYSTTVDKYGHLSLKSRKEIAKITDKYI